MRRTMTPSIVTPMPRQHLEKSFLKPKRLRDQQDDHEHRVASRSVDQVIVAGASKTNPTNRAAAQR